MVYMRGGCMVYMRGGCMIHMYKIAVFPVIPKTLVRDT